MATVYLDASFISACVTDRTDPRSIVRRDVSRDWWDSQRSSHDLFVSQEVLNELAAPSFRSREEALALVEHVPMLEVDEEVTGVAEIFVREYLMPGPAVGDAVHLAACAVHGVQFLLSWNVRHLANPNKVAHLQAVCRRIGLSPPQIVTPEFLWED
jgi:predicted nucleic acid-binding protein